ncbi:MAG: phosphoribosylanthranilate isomerase [Bacteroidota bacterium]
MKLKVCGMANARNIMEIAATEPDCMGFIFYQKSPRFAGNLRVETLRDLPASIKKVGVFVDEELDNMLDLAAEYQLDYIQLHGSESLDVVKKLKNAGLGVLKVFKLTNQLPENLETFGENVDYILFDTASEMHGGSGKKFDWSVLDDYQIDTPFILSGGIDLSDVDQIKKMRMPQLKMIDVNSRFEDAPGMKNVAKIKALKKHL